MLACYARALSYIWKMQTAAKCKHCMVYAFCWAFLQLLVSLPKPQNHNCHLNLWRLQLALHFC